MQYESRQAFQIPIILVYYFFNGIKNLFSMFIVYIFIFKIENK